MSLWVEPVACLRDNYAYLIGTEGSTDCIVLDPSAADPIRARLGERSLDLVAIFNTHHHHDHTGGNRELVREFDLPVYAHLRDRQRIPGVTHALDEGDRFSLLGIEFSVLHLPGHTEGAITYRARGYAFTGDTLFMGGCGRLKEGTAPQLFASLERMKVEFSPTDVCCTGHEYTEANLRFSASLEPENAAVLERLELVRQARGAGEPTAQGPFAQELATNPFLRTHEPVLARAVGLEPGAAPVEVFARLRRMKDDF